MMTPESLCAELRELYKFRNAIDIIADRHDCTYTDIIKLIGNTKEFDIFDATHSRHTEAVQIKDKKTNVKWDKRIESDVKRLYLSGYSSSAISVIYGTSECTINRHLKKMCVEIRKRPMLSPHMYDDIKRQIDEGVTRERLAMKYHVKKQTLINFMDRQGVIN